MEPDVRLKKFTVTALLVCAGLLAVSLLGAWLTANRNFAIEYDALIARETQSAQQESDNLAAGIRRNLHYIAGIPQTFSHALRVWKAIDLFDAASPPTSLPKAEVIAKWTKQPALSDLNQYLAAIRSNLGVDQLFVVNAAGDGIASSLGDQAGTPIGSNYLDRKWFVDAQQGRNGFQFAIGKTTGIAGFYFSSPIFRDGAFKGAIVVKVDVPNLSFLLTRTESYVADVNGVIILSHEDDMLMQALPGAPVFALPAAARGSLYRKESFLPLPLSDWPQSGAGKQQLKHLPGHSFPHVLMSSTLPEYGMTVYSEGYLHQLAALERDRRNQFFLLALLSALLIISAGGVTLHLHSLRQSQRALHQSEAEMRLLLGSVNSGIWGQTPDGVCTFVNPAAEKILGYTHDELIGTKMHALVHHSHPDGSIYPQQECPMFATGQDGQTRTTHDEVLWHKNGTPVEVMYSASPLVRNDQLEGAVIVFEDVSLRKEMERLVKEQEIVHGLAIKTSIDGYWMLDAQGYILEVNDAYLLRSGYRRDEMLTLHIADIDAQESVQNVRHHLAKVIQDGHDRFESTHRAKDGQLWPLALAVSYTPMAGGRIFCFMQDLTEREHQKTLLEAALSKANSASQAKSDFLANMSHEIRTPMNAVIGMSQLALETSDEQQKNTFVQQVVDSSKSLLHILNDILDFSKIEAGHMSIEIAPFDLDLMLTGIENLFAFRARENGLTFSVSKASNVPRFFQGDVHRLRQVLANLLGNAIKFTQHGNVALTVSLREPPSEKAHLRLCVQDSGIGMSESQLAGLFQPFVQADSSISRRFGGTGLGLAISKKLVELMEGQITVESTAGVGSRFYIELALPLAPTPETAQDNSAGKQLHKEILHGKSVLLVEDNKVNQTLAAHLLKKLGMTFEIANHGQEAIDKLHARDFDIVLMDIQMPVMNGLEATELIRREPRYTTLPIIAMSAGVTLDEQERCVEVGMSGFVGKPVHFDELTGKLIEMLSAQA